jgi:hypothetical protein
VRKLRGECGGRGTTNPGRFTVYVLPATDFCPTGAETTLNLGEKVDDRVRIPEHQAVVDYVNAQRPGDSLKRRAEELLYELGQSDLFRERDGGVVGHLIRQDNPGWTKEQVLAAMRGLGIPSDYVPTTAILRDALPHAVHLRRLLLPLTGGYVEKREDLVQKLGGLAKVFETPDAPLQLSLDELRELAKGFTVG